MLARGCRALHRVRNREGRCASSRLDETFLTDAQASLLAADSDRTYAHVIADLNDAPALARDKRVAFYAFGAGEAMLLDRVRQGWHANYLDPRLDLSVFF
jgi:hypothetical protein